MALPLVLLLFCLSSWARAQDSVVISTTSSLGGFYNLAKSFINAAEPNQVPYDEISTLIDWTIGNGTQTDLWGTVQPILVYSAGFVALLVIGIIFMVVMPLIGCCFCCCPCCCCKPKKSSKPKSMGCCLCYSVFIVIISVFLVAGSALYIANDFESYADLEANLVNNVNKQLKNVLDYSDSLLKDVSDATVFQLKDISTKVITNLDAAADEVISSTRNMTGMSALMKLNTTATQLSSSLDILVRSADDLKNNGSQLSSSITAAGLDTSHTDAILKALDEYIQVNVPSLKTTVEEAKKRLQNIMSLVEPGSSYDKVDQSLMEFNQTYQQSVSSVNQSIQSTYNELQSTYDDASDFLTDLKTQSNDYEDQLSSTLAQSVFDTYDWVTWALLVVILPILVILVLVVISLIVGCFACCTRENGRPAKTTCLSRCSGRALGCSVGLAFFFSLFLMLITIVVFILGFSGEAFLCRSFFPDPSQVINFVQRQSYIDPEGTVGQINVTTAIVGCRNNDSFYRSFQVEKFFDVNKEMSQLPSNITIDYNEFLKFSENDIYTQNQTALLKIQKDLLQSLSIFQPFTISEKSRFNRLNDSATTFIVYLNSLKKTDLIPSITSYRDAAQSALANDQSSLDYFTSINDTIGFLLQINTSDIMTMVNKTNELINSTVNSQIDYINTVSNYSVRFITEEAGRCRALYDVYQNLGEILCSELFNPLDGVWVALGWCLFFFIPFVVLGIKLTPYLKEMNFKSDIPYNPIKMVKRRTTAKPTDEVQVIVIQETKSQNIPRVRIG